jgi:hypothetical protein
MTLFFDRTVGKRIADALRLLDLVVERHDDHFSQLTYDDVWLQAIGERGWVAVTHDDLRRNPAAMRALVDHKVGCFLIRGGASRRNWFTVRVLARNWERIEEIANSQARPFLYRLYLRQAASPVVLPPAG